MEALTTILIATWAFKKFTMNSDPDKSEEQEEVDAKASLKHQSWQTADLTEPWGKL